MGICYPLSQDDQRSYPEGFNGRVFIWDIDKTYLSTHFSSLKGMARIPIEFAIDKQAIPGMPEVLRGLRRGPGPEYAAAPLYFISASPPQIRKVVERKMLLDGVEYDGITFKDWVKTILKLRPGRLREQIGFKMCALLATRQNRPQSKEYLFGDDVESDAEAFHLYARLLSGRLSAGEAEAEMKSTGIKPDDRECIHNLLDRLGDVKGTVEKIFIHLEHQTPVDQFSHLAPLVVPVKGSVQIALACYQLNLLDLQAVRQALTARASSPAGADIQKLIQDALERGLISKKKYAELEIVEPAGG
ncbi:MAG: hypothetical protein JRJ87_16255 [Deltaproteobacteria bacterium]|nr:hypothetical protein [Deltaproteobacteria bacterium]